MPQDNPVWSAVDSFIESTLLSPDEVLSAVVSRCHAASLPAIAVSPAQGRLLHLLALSCNAKRILEVGTLGGYSTICMARALPPGGKLISLEIDPHHAHVAQANFVMAKLEDAIELRLGPATDSLHAMQAVKEPPFDLVFIDADKENNAAYFDAALTLSHPGTLIVIDNVVRDGQIADAASIDSRVQASRAVLEHLGSHPRVTATAIQTVGVKGYDGFALARVN